MDSPVPEGLPWWLWFLVILLLVALAIWLWLCLRKRLRGDSPLQIEADSASEVPSSPPVAEPAVGMPLAVATTPPDREPQVMEQPVVIVPDDLKRIEGIGPKIAGLCQSAGISTFAELAATDVDRLRAILAEARLSHLADPATWPEQAELAAASRWHDLAALQNMLKGGRRV